MLYTKHLPDEERFKIWFEQIKRFAKENSISFEQIEMAHSIGMIACQMTGYIQTEFQRETERNRVRIDLTGAPPTDVSHWTSESKEKSRP